PNGLLSQLGYGGSYFNVTLSSDDLNGNASMISTAKVVIIRPGFSTHALNMGQRYIELQSTYTGNADNTGVLHVSQLPPNPAIFPPGPALVFVLVNGVPSIGQQVMIGSGKIEKQPVAEAAVLPESRVIAGPEKGIGGNGSSGSGKSNENGAVGHASVGCGVLLSFFLGLLSSLL
ncbi:hypothetical protein FRC07_005266, partial [Ceratobasidium sp. 392]